MIFKKLSFYHKERDEMNIPIICTVKIVQQLSQRWRWQFKMHVRAEASFSSSQQSMHMAE